MVKKVLLLTLLVICSLGGQCHYIDTTDYYGSPKSYLDVVTTTNSFDPSYLTRPYRLYIEYDDMVDDEGFVKLSYKGGYVKNLDNIISYSSERSDTSLVLGVVRYNGVDYINWVDSICFMFGNNKVCTSVNNGVILLTDEFKENLRCGNITHIKVYSNSGAKELLYDSNNDCNNVLRYVLGITKDKSYNDGDGRTPLFLGLFCMFCLVLYFIFFVIYIIRYKKT